MCSARRRPTSLHLLRNLLVEGKKEELAVRLAAAVAEGKDSDAADEGVGAGGGRRGRGRRALPALVRRARAACAARDAARVREDDLGTAVRSIGRAKRARKNFPCNPVNTSPELYLPTESRTGAGGGRRGRGRRALSAQERRVRAACAAV